MTAVFASLASATLVGIVGVAVATRRSSVPANRHQPKTVIGLDVTPFQFWSTVVLVAGVTFLCVVAITGLVAVSLVPAIVVATLPKTYFSRKRTQRLNRVQEAWPDGLRDILASVRSGASLPVALEHLSSFGPEALRQVFQGFDIYSKSMGVIAALEMIKDDLADPTSDRIIEVLILAYERGGTVVPEILSDLAEATTRDLWTTEQIRTEALEQKINARVVFVLPWLVLVAITARPGPFRDFYASASGLLVVALGGVLSLIGIAIATRLGRQPDEPRVFGRTG